MARKKKGGFGKFIGSLGGNPYDRLMGQFDRTVKQHEDDEDELADQLDRFVRIARRRFDGGEIDDEEQRADGIKRPCDPVDIAWFVEPIFPFVF